MDTKEIELLFPQGKVVKMKGQDVTIMPFGFGKFPKVLDCIKRLKLGDVNSDESGAAKVQAYDSLQLVMNNADIALELIALAIGKPLSYFDDLPPDEGIAAGLAVIEVNQDFFVNRLQPMATEALGSLAGLVGEKSPVASLQPGTATPT